MELHEQEQEQMVASLQDWSGPASGRCVAPAPMQLLPSSSSTHSMGYTPPTSPKPSTSMQLSSPAAPTAFGPMSNTTSPQSQLYAAAAVSKAAAQSSGPNLADYQTVFTNAKAGMEGVDKEYVKRVVYEMSKDSPHFANEQRKQAAVDTKIKSLKEQAAALSIMELQAHTLQMDKKIAALEAGRDLSRTWLHVDMDAFFAACEELANPALADVPMAVGGIGMICTANYHARKFGVRSAMPGFIAKKLCPHLQFVRPNFQRYSAASEGTRAVFARYDPQYESASLDEAYLDITDYCAAHQMTGPQVAAELRAAVQTETQLTCSCGVAPNKMLAKVCSDINKPNGQYVLSGERDKVAAFVATLPVRKVPGVGKVMEQTLAALNVRVCADLHHHRGLIAALFLPASLNFLMAAALGLGSTRHAPPAGDNGMSRKGISCERTFRPLSSKADLEAKATEIVEHLCEDMARESIEGNNITLKLKNTAFQVTTHAKTLRQHVHQAQDILPHVLRLLHQQLPCELRLLGVRMSGLRKRGTTVVGALDRFVRPKNSREQQHEQSHWRQEQQQQQQEQQQQTWPQVNLELEEWQHQQQQGQQEQQFLGQPEREGWDGHGVGLHQQVGGEMGRPGLVEQQCNKQQGLHAHGGKGSPLLQQGSDWILPYDLVDVSDMEGDFSADEGGIWGAAGGQEAADMAEQYPMNTINAMAEDSMLPTANGEHPSHQPMQYSHQCECAAQRHLLLQPQYNLQVGVGEEYSPPMQPQCSDQYEMDEEGRCRIDTQSPWPVDIQQAYVQEQHVHQHQQQLHQEQQWQQQQQGQQEQHDKQQGGMLTAAEHLPQRGRQIQPQQQQQQQQPPSYESHQAVSRRSTGPSTGNSSTWTCRVCTYAGNQAQVLRCDVCETWRGSDTPSSSLDMQASSSIGHAGSSMGQASSSMGKASSSVGHAGSNPKPRASQLGVRKPGKGGQHSNASVGSLRQFLKSKERTRP